MSDRIDDPGASIEPAPHRELATPDMPFEGLDAPTPIEATPPPVARWLGFGAVILAGLLGGMIGWGTGDVLGRTSSWAAVGAFIGAVGCAVGVGIVASLTLRAMNEWNEVKHPEARLRTGAIADAIRPADETQAAERARTAVDPAADRDES